MLNSFQHLIFIMKKSIGIVLVTLLFQIGFSQNPDRIYQSHSEENGLFSVTTNDGKYIFQFYTEDVLETTFVPNGEIQNKNSHAVVLSPKAVATTYGYFGKDIIFSTDGMSVTITTTPFKITYKYNGEPLISEKRGYFKNEHQPMDLVKGNIVADSTEKIEFNLTKDEVLYGGGARALGMNRRGYRLPLFNRAHYGYETQSELMNYTLPIVLSSKQYMIHFDNAPIGYLDLDSKKENTLTYETISGRKTYQIIAGESWYDILDNYTYLTGKQPMLPRWTLGNFSSRFGYHTQEETLKTIDKFREEEIPVDAIILDLYWFGKDIKGTMGNLEFDKDSFPNPKQMIKDLQSKDVETILITEPFILTTSKRWDEAVKEDVLARDSIGNPATYDFYFGNTGIVDVYSDKGNTWFKTIYKDLSNMGVTGFWGDLGEPEVHPSWVQHATGTADDVHNIYGHDWAKLVYEASLEANPEQRPFILMRAGYSGSQRYGLVPWSGDVNRTWGGLQSQPEIALQMGLQGLAYMHSDLGGFAGANLDDELYVRWLQYGVFQPIYRPHAQEDVPSEPVFRSEKAKNLAKYAIQMRYRMLPYNYSLMYDNSHHGKPLMRPLFFEEPDNDELYSYSSTYLWGQDILVSPVLEPGKKLQEVYFPKGSDWFDIENDELIEGGQTQTVALNEAIIPTYIRAGAFIPLAKPMQTTKDYDSSFIQLQYYHHDAIEESERTFYFDDGKTVEAFDKGQFQILEFEAEMEGRWLEIDFEAETGTNYKAENKTIELVIHNIKDMPKRIKINNDKANGTYNKKYKTLTLNIIWDTNEEKEIRIKLK
jgi:oligosaccharide 4-alpha-D-glucosyltransferase